MSEQAQPVSREGLGSHAVTAKVCSPDRENSSGGGHAIRADKACLAMPTPEAVAVIRSYHRERCFAMGQRKRADQALGAFLRLTLGWRRDAPATERTAIQKRAAALIKTAQQDFAGKNVDEPDETYTSLRPVLLAAMASREPWALTEKAALKSLTKAAEALPVWQSWGVDVRGFGAASLGMIVAEAGDLSAYPKKGHLWKRMGLAVFDGVRQGGLRKSASADDWIEHGYNKQRRSRMFLVGETLVKAGSFYREQYLARKFYETERAEAEGLAVLPADKINASNKATSISKGHIHRRAQRHMEKRFLRDLRAAWIATITEQL